ncbi:MAG: hypothetical protein HY726_04500 [Candidatus Rokubacteria bacterium]|nr:hypothetical protein [Candidatus Rokubacteria bacterium]
MMLRWGAVALALGLTGCAQQQATSPSIEAKTFALKPATASVKVSFLTGELKDLKVIERVEQGTGRVVDPPKLRATLTLKNPTSDQAARLISARIRYADVDGKPIPLADGRGDTSFKFYGYQERLDPGMEASQDIEVPFPAAALEEKKLGDIRLELSYIPTPYREETISIRVSLAE